LSDATLIAGELQDLATSVDQLAVALRDRDAAAAPVVNVVAPETPAPVINVVVAEQTLPQPAVHVTVPVPTVQVESPAPTVNVLPSKPNAYEVRITERDASGFILAFVITPVPGA
jgi:hypothetical protein